MPLASSASAIASSIAGIVAPSGPLPGTSPFGEQRRRRGLRRRTLAVDHDDLPASSRRRSSSALRRRSRNAKSRRPTPRAPTRRRRPRRCRPAAGSGRRPRPSSAVRPRRCRGSRESAAASCSARGLVDARSVPAPLLSADEPRHRSVDRRHGRTCEKDPRWSSASSCRRRLYRMLRLVTRPLLIIFLTIFVNLVGFGIIIPLLPFYAETFGASPLVIGLLFAVVLDLPAGRRPGARRLVRSIWPPARPDLQSRSAPSSAS